MNIDINLLDDIIKKVLSERKLQLTDRSQKKIMYVYSYCNTAFKK